MLAFDATVKVVEVLRSLVTINDYTYRVCLVEAGSIKIPALIRKYVKVKPGAWIGSSRCYLTQVSLESEETLALRLERATLLEGDIKPMEKCIIRCNGKIAKSRKAEMCRLGVMQRPFYACTLVVKNECNTFFGLLLKGSYAKAEVLRDIPNGAFIDCEAILCTGDSNNQYSLALQSYKLT